MMAASSRERILERVGTVTAESRKWNAASSTGRAEPSGIPRDYIRRGSLNADACVAKMIERLREYDAEVTECAPEGLAAEIASQIARRGRKTLIAPAGVPQEWLAPDCEWKIDGHLSGGTSSILTIDEVEHADGVLTAGFCGVADSGTIVLHHSPAEGRRVITLLPDWHLCVLFASQIVETLPEYFEQAGSKGAREQGSKGLPGLVTWISGPSATADIEMTRIKGVHGPRFLNVIVVKGRE